MSNRIVKKIRIGRLPNTEITVIDFDGIAFALDYDHLVEIIAASSKSLNGIHINRRSEPASNE